MGILSKNEKDLMKLLPVAFPIVVILILIFVLTSWYTSKSAVTPFENILLDENASITLCQKEILKTELIQVAFKKFRYTKVSGSSPVKFYSLNGISGNNTSEFSLGQDSKNTSLFWLFPKQTSTYMRGPTIGFIESEYIKENIDKCE